MGQGTWVTCSYNATVKGMGFSSIDEMRNAPVQQIYRARKIDPDLNPYKVVRECCDSDEHPNTIPIILGLDVTGSMSSACAMCAAKLDEIMTKLYEEVQDVEFMMMGIGDLAYDEAPIQATQFESDIRILDQTAKIYFEGHGGGNAFESYTAAWYFGLHNTKLDCWKRGKKGIIITMGDEPLNPYLPSLKLNRTLGCTEHDDVDTKELYKQVLEKFDVYHIAITNDSSYWRYKDEIKRTWGELLGQNLIISTSDNLPDVISGIVKNSMSAPTESVTFVNEDGEISW